MRTTGIVVDLAIAIIIILAFSIRFYGFQTYVAKQFASFLSEELKAKVSLDGLEIDLVKRVHLDGLLIKDLKDDTLLYAPKVTCIVNSYSVRKRIVNLKEIRLVSPVIKLAKYKNEKDLNFQFLADYFEDDSPSSNKRPWKLNCKRIKLVDANFSMHNYNKSYAKFGIDFDHLGLRKLNVSLSDFRNHGDTNVFRIQNLALIEQSGFEVDTLNSTVKITPTTLSFSPLMLRTPDSKITAPFLSFYFDDFSDFDHFENKVRMSTYLSSTQLHLRDLSYFVHELEGANQKYLLNGKFDGTVNNFEADNFTCAYSQHTFLRGTFKIKDVTDIDKAYFDVNISKLVATKADLDSFRIPPYTEMALLDLPKEVQRMGDIDYIGTFKGTVNDFVTNGSILSSIGFVTADMKMKRDTVHNTYIAQGKMSSSDLNIGQFLNEELLGKISTEVIINASGKDFDKNMNVKIQAKIDMVEFNGYAYHNVTADGNVRGETFMGDLKVRDENLTMDYNGRVELGKKIPSYDFYANVYNANITKLNIGNRDESANISFRLKTRDAKGLNLDDVRGVIDLYNVRFCEKGKDYDFNDLHLEARELPDTTKKLLFHSDILSMDVNGRFNFAELGNVFMSITSKAVPSLFDNKIIKIESNEVFNYKINLKDFSMIQELFIPELELSRGIGIDGKFDSKQNIFRFTGKNIKKIKYGDQYIENLKIVGKNNDDILTATFKAENISVNDSIQLQNFELETQAFNNNTESHITWLNKGSGNSGNISLLGSVLSHDNFNFTVQPSEVRIKQGLWRMEQIAHINIDSTTIEIDEFDAYCNEQSISVNGMIAKDTSKQLVASLCNFKLETITPLLLGTDLSFKGDINGNVVLSNVYTKPDFVNSLAVDSLIVNDEWVGDVDATNYFEKGSDRIITHAKIIRKDQPMIGFDGYYRMTEDNKYSLTNGKVKVSDSLNYTISFRNANLQFLNGFLPPDVSNFQSLLDGDIRLTGTPDEPIFRSKKDLKIHDGSIKINMLNTSYFIEKGSIGIFPDMIALNSMKITDVRGHPATVNGTYNHKNFENGNFSFDLDFQNMLALNTTEEMNDLYFGKAYATGTASILGYGDKIDVEINATTNKGSKLTLPMYGVSDVSVGDFVVFVSKDSVIKEKEINLDGITLVFNLDVTPEAEVNIVFDKLSGAQLKARGAGLIKMEITPLGEFVMNGAYEIDDPSVYKLAMQTIINKNFIVAKGGTIKWYGDPLNAEIDITAVYKLQASVFDIMPVDIQSSYKKNVDVNVDIELKNSLYKPDFVFDFNVPKADENVRAAIAGVKNTREELFRQTMSLLIINKFLTPSNAIGTSASNNSNIAANYTSELITNQLNSLLSQISKDFDIGVNYKPGDEISNEEIAVAFSTQALDGRLNISTNVGVSNSTGGSSQQNQNSLIGDFNIEYLLSESGDVRVHAYNESNDFDITNLQQAPYTQGVGLYYQKEFDTAKDLIIWQKFLNVFRRKENDVPIDKKDKTKP